MLATENRTRSLIKPILAIALPVVGRQIRTMRVHGAILVALLGVVDSGFSQTTTKAIPCTVCKSRKATQTLAISYLVDLASGDVVQLVRTLPYHRLPQRRVD